MLYLPDYFHKFAASFQLQSFYNHVSTLYFCFFKKRRQPVYFTPILPVGCWNVVFQFLVIFSTGGAAD